MARVANRLDCLLQRSNGRAAPFTSFGSLIERNRALDYAARGPVIQARVSQKAYRKDPRCLIQRAGFASPHAAGDGLSGVISDGEAFAFISGPAGVVGGVPVTRAMNPWAMPEASTKRPQIFPWSLIPFSDVKVDPG
jgi:hypothetical protein